MPELQTYSCLIRWNDMDLDQGDFGTIVRATSYEDAERLARIDMRNCHIENHGEDTADEYEQDDGTFGGTMIECTEGAIWKAKELETALRGLLAQCDEIARTSGWLDNVPREAARKVIEEIDAIGTEG